jgi:hypothetical protein
MILLQFVAAITLQLFFHRIEYQLNQEHEIKRESNDNDEYEERQLEGNH